MLLRITDVLQNDALFIIIFLLEDFGKAALELQQIVPFKNVAFQSLFMLQDARRF